MMALAPRTVFMYPVAQPATPDGTVLEEYGIIPTLEVGLDREKLLKGIDSELESALEYIRNQIDKLNAFPQPFCFCVGNERYVDDE